MGLWETLYAFLSLVHMILALLQLAGYRNLSDGRFPTAKVLVLQCFNACLLITIQKFFQKFWRYIDAYKKGLNARQAAVATKKYKSHRKVGLPGDIIASMYTSDVRDT